MNIYRNLWICSAGAKNEIQFINNFDLKLNKNERNSQNGSTVVGSEWELFSMRIYEKLISNGY